jgi:TonB family protein
VRPAFALGLPLAPRRITPSAGLSLLLHGALLALLLWVGAVRLKNAGGRGLGAAGGGGGGAAPRAVNFFVLPPSAPATVDVPTPPKVEIARLLQLSKIDVPRLDSSRDSGSGGSTGPGASPGRGTGSAEGPGTGGEGDYIVIASPRTAILPPLAKVPGSVAGHTYRIRFWVGADGRVTRVEIDPPIADGAYGRDLLERMRAYQFYPARTRDGRAVASVVTVPLRIGN